MRCNAILFSIGIFLGFSGVVQGQQYFPAKDSSYNTENAAPSTSASNCDANLKATGGLGQQPAENGARGPQVPSDPVVTSASAASAVAALAAVTLEQDLKFLMQRRDALAQCLLAAAAQESGTQDPSQDSPGACEQQLFLKFEMRHDGETEHDVPIGRFAGSAAFFYEAGMTIDADGAPNAYHPDNTGLDDLANAGTPGRWEGLAKDADGEPYIQGPGDPFPGYYVSATALADRSKPANDPARYVDASKIPFIVLPGGMARQLGARPGDFAVVFNPRNGKSSYAIFGDVGPFDRIGEGSVALAENLGIRSDARNGGARWGILYLVFPGSGNGQPRPVDEINGEGEKLLRAWEASLLVGACAAPPAEVHTVETNRGAN
jgi:hypothetical protein